MSHRTVSFILLTIVGAMGVGCGGELEAEADVGSIAQGVGCTGSACNGQDPIAMGCSADAVTVAGPVDVYTKPGLRLGQVELRYSAACNAKWAKFYNYTGGAQGSTYLKNSSGTISNTVYTSSQAQIYGNMNSGTVRACGEIVGWTPSCTNYY